MKSCESSESWKPWAFATVNHCGFNLYVWLGVYLNLLSHKASTIHQMSSWNESSINMWHIVSCFPSQPFFLHLGTSIFFAWGSSFQIQALDQDSPLTCLKHLGIAPLRGLIVAESEGECAISSAVIIFNFQVIFPKTVLGNIISRPTPTQVSNCTAWPAWHCGL